MLIIQYLIILFAAFLIARTLVNFQRHKLELRQAILWILIWIILLIVAILPEVMGVPAAILGIQRSVDVFVYVGIIILFYLCFYLYNKSELNRERITRLTRIIAIQQAETEALIMEKANNNIKKTRTTRKVKKVKPKKKKPKRKRKK
jgi:hypothetical protein